MKTRERCMLALVCVMASRSVAGAPAVSVALVEPGAAVFGGREAVFHATINAEAGTIARVGWTLRVAQRVILRRETPLTIPATAAATIEIRLSVPPVKPGVVMPADLEVQVWTADPAHPPATLTRRLWIFPEDPFAARGEWLAACRIRLFDPDTATADLFESLRIPYEYVSRPAALDGESEPVTLLLGAGLDFDDYPGLDAVLARLARGGHRVLCLAPGAGDFVLPGTAPAAGAAPARLEFRRADIVRDLDKRLDHAAWPQGEERAAVTGLILTTRGGMVVGRVTSGADAWPWVSARYSGGGRLVVCGFPIVASWGHGPTPRFLLLRLLEWLAKTETKLKEEGP